MTRILLIDTNFSSGPIYKYLVESGYEVYLVGGNPVDFLAKSMPNYIQADYSNLDSLKKIIKKLNIKYIIPGCNDVSYQACSALNISGNYPGIDGLSVNSTLNNKKQFRDFALSNAISTPKLMGVNEVLENKELSIVVKPVDAFSGKGITIIHRPDTKKMALAIAKAVAVSREKKFIIEEFIEGNLYSHSAFISKRKIVIDFIVAEYGSVNPLVVDISHLDYAFSQKVRQKIQFEIEKIAELLDLCDGLIHTQFIMGRDGFRMIEITRRCPGDLYSQLIEMSTGYKYAENYARSFIGESLSRPLPIKKNLPIVRNTISQSDHMIFSSINFLEDCHVMRFIPIAATGDKINPSPDGRVGILFIKAKSEKNTPYLVKKITEHLLYSIDSMESFSENL